MNWGGYTDKGNVLHGWTDDGRPACGVRVTMTVGVPPEIMETLAVCKRCRAAERGRPVYVYRLAVTYPEGVDWINPPAAWERDYDPEGSGFQWPRVHPYLSRSGAKTRADLLIRYGCTVTIERSEPVIWA